MIQSEAPHYAAHYIVNDSMVLSYSISLPSMQIQGYLRIVYNQTSQFCDHLSFPILCIK
jgi:hypothetical protein